VVVHVIGAVDFVYLIFDHFKAPVITHELCINFIIEVADVANNRT
jgi:hypothetical protein